MYTTQEAKIERSIEVKNAVENRDIKALFRLAKLEKSEQNDEFAESLQQLAQRYKAQDRTEDEDEDSYRQERGNYYAESHYYPSE